MIGKRLLFLSILLLFTLNILAALNLYKTTVSAVEYPAIYVEPATTVDLTLSPGSTYTVSVKTDYTGDDINSWQFTLNYNPDILQMGLDGLNYTDIWTGTGAKKSFEATGKLIVPDSEDIYVGGVLKTKDVDYTINYLTGMITFTTAPGTGVQVKATYLYTLINGDLIAKDKDPSATFIPGEYDNMAGELPLTGAFFYFVFEPAVMTSGPGTLANITFTVVGYGASDITLGPETKLIGYSEDGYGDPYDIVDTETMPSHIQHGTVINVQPIHDVAVGLVAPDEAVVGQLVPINVTVVNKGTYHEDVTLTVSYDDAPINTTTFALTLLKGGLNETFSFKWNTTGLTPGNYVIEAAATIAQDDEPANNKVPKPIALKLAHDVAVTSLVAPEEGVVGQLVPINVTVVNKGTYHEDVTLTVSYDDAPINIIVISMLLPGESETVEFSWDTAAGVAEGNYVIEAAATILQDDNTGDNNKTKPIALTFVRDVAVIDITSTPDMPIVGQLVTINVTVENHGSYSKDSEVWFTCNVTIVRLQETVYTSERQSVTPPVGDSIIISFNWNTMGITSGLYKIIAEAKLAEDVNPNDNSAKPKDIFVKSSLGAIHGYVKDSSTGEPIAGANVTADTVAFDTTSEAGYYKITDMEPGTYNVTVSADGYEGSSKTITVTAGETTVLNFNLTPLMGIVTGTVTDSLTGEPIPGANVTAGDYTNTTDAEGHYSIKLPPGTYNITASATKYVDQSKTATVTASTTTTLDFALTPLNGTISGTVRDSSTGEPIAGATVTANDISVSTGADGSYNIELAPGTYNVTVSADGYEGSSKTITVTAGENTTLNFNLTPVRPLNILLYAGVAAIAIIIIAGIAVYILKFRKPT